jgi:hypothetical protein
MVALNSQDPDQETKALLQSVWLSKYIVTVLLLVVLLFGVIHFSDGHGFGVKELLLELAGASLAAVALSLYYDIFMQRQQRLELKLQRTELLRDYAVTVLGPGIAHILTKPQLGALLKELLKRPHFIDDLAHASGVASLEEARAMTEYLQPLIEPPRFHKVNVSNKLTLDPSDQSKYRWSCRERLTLNQNVNSFRILITDQNDIAIKLCRPQRIDCLILLSEKAGGLSGWGQHQLSVTARCGTRDIPVSLKKMDGLEKVPKNAAASFLMFEASTPSEETAIVVTIEFDQSLSLDDPYFYWATDAAMYVEEISIDYNDLIHIIGDVSVLSFCASSSLVVTHKPDRGIVRAEVGSFLSAGEGIEIVWRPK